MALDTRDRLIRTTSRILRTQGYAATGLNRIMAEAEAPKGSMYFHFPGGKEELAAAAVDNFAGRVTGWLHQRLEDNATVREAVLAVLDAYVQDMERTDYRNGCAVATVALDASATHDLLAESTGRALREWVDVLAAALETEGRSPEEAHGLATLVIAVFEGVIVMAKGERSTEPITAAREVMSRVLA